MRALNIDEQIIVNGGIIENPYYDKSCVAFFLGYYAAIIGTYATLYLLLPANDNSNSINLMTQTQGNGSNPFVNVLGDMCYLGL